ncbi:MAG: hypothetical protein OSB41_07695, partial [Kiritimatiellae bacterium]|nr:hypothetical protein [Kiritimatiellia bacterium]
QKAAGVTWAKSLAEAKKTAAKKDFPIAIWWSDGSGTDTPVTPKGRFGDLEKEFIWVRLDKTEDAATLTAIGVDAYFAMGNPTDSSKTMHRTSGYVFMNAKGDIYARLPGNKAKWSPDWFDSMLISLCRRHYGPEKFYVDKSVDISGASDPSAFGRPKKMSAKVKTRKTPTELHTWKSCDICKGFLDKAMPYIESQYPGNWYGGMLGAWPANAALTMYGKDALVKKKYLKSAQDYYKNAPTVFAGYLNWFRAGNAMSVTEYALQHGLTPDFEKILVDTQQYASEYIDESMAWFHHPRRGGRNYSSKQGLIASLFHASFVEMEFMGLEAEPGLSLARSSQGRYAYGSSDQPGKTGLLVAALYASGWPDDPFTSFQRDPMLNGPEKDRGVLSYPRANFPGYAHGYAPWAWMGCAVGLHRMGPAEYAEWADLWVHPLITLQLEDGSIPKLPNDTFPQGPHAVGDDPMPYINLTKKSDKGIYECTAVVAAIVLMTEPGAYWGLPIKPSGSLPNKKAFDAGKRALTSRDYPTAYANFAIVLPPGDHLELVPQARIHMRELQIKLSPDRAERRKRARKIASFSAEKRAKGEIAIYAKAAKRTSAHRARSNTPAMPIRTVKAKYAKSFDAKLLAKIAALAGEGKLPTRTLMLSISTGPILIRGADPKALTVKLRSGGVERDQGFRSLKDTDRAMIAMAVAELEPTNQGLAAVAAFMLECAGRPDIAKAFFKRAGAANAKKVNDVFEPLPAKE